mmetsp:Transcript_18932/g.17176  ORF Transcript_18932/g.17176 Transcript_18932/m.17176 type:complete len:546 (+) Transcript_18932:59-1696(+)
MLRTTSLINKTITKRLALNCFSSVTENKINLIKQYVDDIDAFDNIKGDIKYDKESSQLLKDLSESTKIQLLHGVNAIMLGNNGVLPFDDSYCANTIFERSFYSDLLKCLNENNNRILIGNPGTSKSMFQYYYLVRLLNPDLFDPLPVNIFGSNSIPNVIIIQIGDMCMTINLIKEKESFIIKGIDESVLKLFDERTAEYWYEPAGSKNEPLFLGIKLPTLITVSPNIERYKEFSKNGGRRSYMPVYELDELLAIGQYIRKNSVNDNLNDFQRKVLSDEDIIMRYEEFDGIFRHVFPYSKSQYDNIKTLKNQAISSFDYRNYGVYMNIEIPSISHFLVKCKVNKNGFSIDYQIINEHTLKRITIENYKVNRDNIIDLLDKYSRLNLDDLYYSFYQRAISLFLTSLDDMKWKKRVITSDSTSTVSYENILIPSKELKIIYEIPHYENMNNGHLYYPRRVNFPLCDMFYKEGDKIVAIQVTRKLTEKSIEITGLNDFMNQVNITDASLIKYVLICDPYKADVYTIKNEIGLKDVELWKIPNTYIGSMW